VILIKHLLELVHGADLLNQQVGRGGGSCDSTAMLHIILLGSE
jgi:hypothetical protein